ncbi:hypothetical protein [Pilimelia terevasa]|uniref:hypothetical protein n=1 Tax=Pilimelia terevasa TaxID=53372 RepID=UPI00166A9002|nr:hypothetical protein [Pilimelia terevasa]
MSRRSVAVSDHAAQRRVRRLTTATMSGRIRVSQSAAPAEVEHAAHERRLGGRQRREDDEVGQGQRRAVRGGDRVPDDELGVPGGVRRQVVAGGPRVAHGEHRPQRPRRAVAVGGGGTRQPDDHLGAGRAGRPGERLPGAGAGGLDDDAGAERQRADRDDLRRGHPADEQRPGRGGAEQPHQHRRAVPVGAQHETGRRQAQRPRRPRTTPGARAARGAAAGRFPRAGRPVGGAQRQGRRQGLPLPAGARQHPGAPGGGQRPQRPVRGGERGRVRSRQAHGGGPTRGHGGGHRRGRQGTQPVQRAGAVGRADTGRPAGVRREAVAGLDERPQAQCGPALPAAAARVVVGERGERAAQRRRPERTGGQLRMVAAEPADGRAERPAQVRVGTAVGRRAQCEQGPRTGGGPAAGELAVRGGHRPVAQVRGRGRPDVAHPLRGHREAVGGVAQRGRVGQRHRVRGEDLVGPADLQDRGEPVPVGQYRRLVAGQRRGQDAGPGRDEGQQPVRPRCRGAAADREVQPHAQPLVQPAVPRPGPGQAQHRRGGDRGPGDGARTVGRQRDRQGDGCLRRRDLAGADAAPAGRRAVGGRRGHAGHRRGTDVDAGCARPRRAARTGR